MWLDSSLNILKIHSHNLDKIFFPKKIALIGATDRPNSVGRTLLKNLLKSFKGTIYPVNPNRKEVFQLKAYPNISSIKDDIDLAILCVPAKKVPDSILQCVQNNVGASIIISAGFKEIGKSGWGLEEQIKKHIKNSSHRIIGPNCLGIMNTSIGLNATFANENAISGNIAFISQSGALCTAILDWSLKENVGFSIFASIGSMLDVDFGDLINYLGNDPNTKSILMYVENIKNPRSFLSAAKEVAMTKPIILIKGGKTEASAKAALSHTGALSERDDVLDAALKRVGVLRVDSISDLFSSCEIVSKQPLPKGRNLAIITNAGGPGVLATDVLIQTGGFLAKLSKTTYERLNKILPDFWSKNNPIDILGDATPERYIETIKIVAKDKNTDGILVILTPQYMTDPKGVALKLKDLKINKPIFTSWMGADSVEEGKKILLKKNISTFSYPEMAVKAFSYMFSYKDNLEAIYETPSSRDEKEGTKETEIKHLKVREILKKSKKFLPEYEAKNILKAYDIPVVETKVARSLSEAKKIALDMGFPLVMKLHSYTILHKTDVGGVKLYLKDLKNIEKAYKEIYESIKKISIKHFQGVTLQPMIKDKGYELILGSSSDPKFGSILLFGLGGELVEVFKDRALELPPLNTNLALRLMKRCKIFEALKGVRGHKKIDISYLSTILVRFSNLISEHQKIKEFDINPLFVSSNKIIALDARCILYDKKDKTIPPAIKPYPHYISFDKVDKTPITIRPIKPEDESLMINFFHTLAKKSILKTFLKELDYSELIAKNRLKRLCFTDYDREIILVAEKKVKEKREILAIARLTKILNSEEAFFSVIVKKEWQGKKIATKILGMLLSVAKSEGIKKLVATISKKNLKMVHLCKKNGFKIIENEEIIASKIL